MKRYDQYCPIACSLGLVGERWTLLVVRELFSGPKRYTDLAEHLPGIGTNILADRLKELEAAGIEFDVTGRLSLNATRFAGTLAPRLVHEGVRLGAPHPVQEIGVPAPFTAARVGIPEQPPRLLLPGGRAHDGQAGSARSRGQTFPGRR